jgi:acetyl-CoA synthetase
MRTTDVTSDIYPVPASWADSATISAERYAADYVRSLDDADRFWLEQAERLEWFTPPSVADQSSFHEADFGVRWFADGVLNVSANCIDRHLATRGDQVAILWEPDAPDRPARRITFTELHAEVCRFANVLKAQGVRRGDRVTLYLPMIPEAAFAMLACTRIGAIHSIVFGGFSPEALAGRITDCDASRSRPMSMPPPG